jgi:hypothetical protein
VASACWSSAHAERSPWPAWGEAMASGAERPRACATAAAYSLGAVPTRLIRRVALPSARAHPRLPADRPKAHRSYLALDAQRGAGVAERADGPQIFQSHQVERGPPTPVCAGKAGVAQRVPDHAMPCHTPCGPEGARVRFRFKNRRRLRHLRGTRRTPACRTCNTKRTGLEKNRKFGKAGMQRTLLLVRRGSARPQPIIPACNTIIGTLWRRDGGEEWIRRGVGLARAVLRF